jgi:H+-translocating NAD(P) transhydrogenase subunit alpha
LTLALLRETHPLEHRVALAPAHVATLGRLGLSLRVESGAGANAGFPDRAYEEAGAVVVPSAREAVEGARIVLRIRPPRAEGPADEVSWLPEGCVLIAHLSPNADPGLEEALWARNILPLAMERVPRTTRAQRMDVLSSQATIAGYAAVLRAASLLPRFFPMLTTAAGTLPPAKVLVLGAGVAGLQAIATARRLGAAVMGYDVREAAREQIRSLGARALEESVQAEATGGYARALSTDEQDRQLAFLASHVNDMDVVITTAQIPGRQAPRLITRAMVESMRPGSVVVDLAAETGGNCELSRAGETVTHDAVTVDAPLGLPSALAEHASLMFGRNILALLEHIFRDGKAAEPNLDLNDEILGPMAVTRPQPEPGPLSHEHEKDPSHG